MKSSCGFSGGRAESCFRSWHIQISVFAISVMVSCRGAAAVADTSKADAERMVASAAQAEIAGDISRSFSLLHDALRVDPDNRSARWQLGEMKAGNKWVSIEEAQRRDSADPRQAQYRDLRAKSGDSPEGQLALAKWCRKNGLNDEAKFHWANVLAVDPKNEEALRALDVRWYNGRLRTTTEIAALKNGSDNSRRREKWEASVTRWRYALAGKNSMSPADALAEIRAVRSVDAILPVEEFTLGADTSNGKEMEQRRDVSLAFVGALEQMPDQPATESLMRHAVWSPLSDVREQAAERLRYREPYNYVPMLLDGLAMPLETSYSIQTSSDGVVHYQHSLYQTGALSDYSVDYLDDARPRFVQYPKEDPNDPIRAAQT